MNKIKVVVIDDSPLIRTLLTEIIDGQPDMEVVALAVDTASALGLVQAHRPDVVTLDVEMPRMDGLGFIDKLMHQVPTAILMISTLTARGPQTTLRALELGAVDYLFKPRKDIQNGMKACAEEIVAKLRIAARAHLRPLASAAAAPRESRPPRVLPALQDPQASRERILVFGASTGGTEALKEVLVQLPADCPAIVIAQHMPEGFTRSFAARLDGLCRLAVKEAEAGEPILPGHVYLAPGHSHMQLARSGGGYACELSQAAPVNRHRPSVDVLFRSAALHAGAQAIGVILTGMGKDGALGLKEMHDAGAHTFAQDEASCVVFGMPREAIAEGAVDEVVPLEELPGRILAHLAQRGSKTFR